VHGYALKFKVTFEGNLDELNWVCDFGCFKRNGIKEHMKYMFDHTTVVAKNDPELESFRVLANKNLIQLRVIDQVGCEKFSEYVYNYIDNEINKETNGRVRVLSVESYEGGTKNSAIYEPIRIKTAVKNLRVTYKNKLTSKQLV
jgi:6-pyruvoyltetrahydropterin/6-carboxytetrahydropterin synthase